MPKRISIAAAVLIVAAGVTTGLYSQSSLLQLFSTFGMDTSNNVGGYNLNSRGEPFFLFDAGDSTVGRWERHAPDEFGGTPGTVWINGVPWKFAADSTVTGGTLTQPGLQVYTLPNEVRAWVTPPLTINISAADSSYWMSGNLWLQFDDCAPDSLASIVSRPAPYFDNPSLYRVRIEQADSLGIYQKKAIDTVDSDMHNVFFLNPGSYLLWFAMVDSLGMEGHYIGPLRVLAGSCP